MFVFRERLYAHPVYSQAVFDSLLYRSERVQTSKEIWELKSC